MGELIVKANEVVEASYHLTTVEQRVILSAIAQIPKGCEVSDEIIYYLTVENLINLGVHSKTAYRDLRQGVTKLYERSVNLTDEENSIKLRWVQEVHFSDNSSEIGIRFSKPILPYISNVSREFTKYYLSDIKGMSSGYAIRLYELITQYQKIGVRELAVDKIREMLQLGKKYPLYADFKKRVIEIAITQINELSPLEVRFEEIKTGRRVTSIKFVFKLKPLKLENDKFKDINTSAKNNIKILTEKQLTRIVQNPQFKLDYNHLISASHPANQSDSAWIHEMTMRVKLKPEQFNKKALESYLEYK